MAVGQSVADGDSLISPGGIFELGFFTPGSSPYRYVGIWFNKIPVRKVVWVANRLNPVAGSAGVLQIGEDGNLVIMAGQNLTWTTGISSVSNESVAEILDSGNLVLREFGGGKVIWQSFDHPSDCFLQNMKVGINLKTGDKRLLISWTSNNDPSPGNFSLGADHQKLPQGVVWKGSARYWRTGQWNGTSFLGIEDLGSSSWVYLNGFIFVADYQEDMIYFTYTRYNTTFPSILVMNYTGNFQKLEWSENRKEWVTVWEAPEGTCVYDTCGPFGVCSESQSPICLCLTGFEPKFSDEWGRGNRSGGCVKETTPVQERKWGMDF